jgi:hypothetical protein
VHALLCRRGRGLLKQGIWEFNRGYHNNRYSIFRRPCKL